MQGFNNVMNNIGLGGQVSNTQTAGQIATSDNFITKIAMIVLGIVIIGGALVLYAKK